MPPWCERLSRRMVLGESRGNNNLVYKIYDQYGLEKFNL